MTHLTWKPIQSNLREAYGELRELHNRLHYLQFGKLPPNEPEDDEYKKRLAERLEKHPFTEYSLYVSLDHAYHHLNWAWNARRTPEEQVWNFSKRSWNRWSRFPKSKVFAALWPPQPAARKPKTASVCRKIHICPVRVHVQLAQQKLAILCRLVKQELDENSNTNSNIVMGNANSASTHLTEQEFARRMHKIYTELNQAWNSRNDKTFVITSRAIQRRNYFPPVSTFHLLCF